MELDRMRSFSSGSLLTVLIRIFTGWLGAYCLFSKLCILSLFWDLKPGETLSYGRGGFFKEFLVLRRA